VVSPCPPANFKSSLARFNSSLSGCDIYALLNLTLISSDGVSVFFCSLVISSQLLKRQSQLLSDITFTLNPNAS